MSSGRSGPEVSSLALGCMTFGPANWAPCITALIAGISGPPFEDAVASLSLPLRDEDVPNSKRHTG
jgi:hypothetical protein